MKIHQRDVVEVNYLFPNGITKPHMAIVISNDDLGSPDKPGGLSIQLCKSEKKEFYIRYSS